SVQCFECGGNGHFAKECANRRKKPDGQRSGYKGKSTKSRSINKKGDKREVVCFACDKKGHHAMDCPNKVKKIKARKTIVDEDSSSSGEEEEDEVKVKKAGAEEELYFVEVSLGGRRMAINIDSGASRTILTPSSAVGSTFSETGTKVRVDGFNGSKAEG